MSHKILTNSWLGIFAGILFGIYLSWGAEPTPIIIVITIMALVGVAVHGVLVMSLVTRYEKKIGFLGKQEEYLNTILYLAAHVVKSDGKIDDSELFVIEKRLLQDFPPDEVKKYMEYTERSLKKDLSIKRICKVIVHDFELSGRIQLVNFLVSIVVVDGWMSKDEMASLKDIAIKIRLPLRSFKSILAMHNYRLEGEQKKYKKVRRSSALNIDRAYAILEIVATVTHKQVKKAYRKLAVLHHPDKVVHLGEEFQKSAKEKFQKISDAYEIIKKKRGFK